MQVYGEKVLTLYDKHALAKDGINSELQHLAFEEGEACGKGLVTVLKYAMRYIIYEEKGIQFHSYYRKR